MRTLFKQVPYKLAISGSFMDKLDHSFPIIQFLNPYVSLQDLYMRFSKRHKSVRDELVQFMSDTIMIRRTKAEVASELPRKNIIFRSPDRDGHTDTIVPDLRALSISEIEEMISTLNVDPTLTIPKMRANDAIGRMGMLWEIIEQCQDNQQRCVVYATHKSVMAHASDFLFSKGVPNRIINGDVPAGIRQNHVTWFNSTEKSVLILGIRSAESGLNLQAASTMVFLESDWSGSKVSQAMDRIHRMGQKANECTYYFLIDQGIESIVFKSFLLKIRRNEMS